MRVQRVLIPMKAIKEAKKEAKKYHINKKEYNVELHYMSNHTHLNRNRLRKVQHSSRKSHSANRRMPVRAFRGE